MTTPLAEYLPQLRASVTAAQHIVFLLDFDGTLAPLVQRPELAILPKSTCEAITALHERPRVTLAFISGRALPDLRSKVGLDTIYAGNHGLEIEGPGLSFHGVDLAHAEEALRSISTTLEDKLQSIPGAHVEDKQSSLSVHYRNVDPPLLPRFQQVVQSVTEPFTDAIALHEGKLVIEIRPRVDWNKGKAAAWILQQLALPSPLIVSAGDDRTDEDIFQCVPESISIKVGEGPTAARFRASNTQEIGQMLEMILAALHPSE